MFRLVSVVCPLCKHPDSFKVAVIPTAIRWKPESAKLLARNCRTLSTAGLNSCKAFGREGMHLPCPLSVEEAMRSPRFLARRRQRVELG